MTPTDDIRAYDQFWAAVEATGHAADPGDPADAYAAFAAAAERA